MANPWCQSCLEFRIMKYVSQWNAHSNEKALFLILKGDLARPVQWGAEGNEYLYRFVWRPVFIFIFLYPRVDV